MWQVTLCSYVIGYVPLTAIQHLLLRTEKVEEKLHFIKKYCEREIVMLDVTL